MRGASQARRKDLGFKSTLLALRWVVSVLMFCFLSFNKSLETGSLTLPLALVAAYVLSNAALYWLPRHRFEDPAIQSALFLFDILVISATIYACQGFDGDLYLVYFVVLLMSGMQMRIWQSFLTGMVASVIYVMLWRKTNPDANLWDADILLRLPFFYIVALFAAFFAQQTKETEERVKETAVAGEKAKLETVFAQMKDGAILTDERGEIVLCNGAARAFLGVHGRASGLLSQLTSAMQCTPPLDSLLSSSEPSLAFDFFRENPQALYLAGTSSRLRFDAVGRTPAWNGRLFIFHDVTEERREERLKRSFLFLISHKLRTPMTSILGFTHLMLGRHDFGPEAEEMRVKALTSISTQARKLADLIDKLLDFLALEEGAPSLTREPFLMAECANEAAQSLDSWMEGRRVELDIAVPPSLKAYGDSTMIRRVLKNLIENSIKFNDSPVKKVRIDAAPKDGGVEVLVVDEGGGIPPEDHERVFAKFFQSERSYTGNVEGWGLGLPFVKKAVEHHGGRVDIRSSPSKGTTIAFTLPGPTA